MKRTAGVVRTVVALCLLAGLGLSASGCAEEPKPSVSVLGPWTGDEEESFEKVLDEFRKKGVDVDYQGTTSLRETLLAQVQAGSPPDIAVLNSVGELTEYAHDGELIPLPEAIRERSPAPWAPELTVDGRKNTYWTPVKVDLKSVVWHYPGKAAGKGAWCLGMGSGATSGWPGTDWIEDILLQRSGHAKYEQWVTGEISWESKEVRDAWETWGRIITADGGRAGAAAALRNGFEGNDGKGLLKRKGECVREHQGSFARRLYGDDVRFTPSAEAVGELGKGNGRGAYEVAGDMAAMFRDSGAARELLTFLTGEAARASWAGNVAERNRPFFPVSVGPYGDAWANRAVDRALTGARRLCLDASDVMPAGVRGAFYRAVLEFLTAPGDVKLLDGLLDQLEYEATRQRERGAGRVPSVCAAPAGGG
ncbi:extracellular solute-binding protein [Streptomyces sp. ISL-98]|uniref:extracellular solute-binding protein n=1 Tax=Streptomyces sp. ISL-98 TaxID=2819192 RepID=UPI001BE64757|nr:extracellular solute-binding protein [Streptomyces sp. ISL-98]MBT2505479.1 extracellular solute-binding protein [Streptomyces sp. ISL-98]